MTTRRRLLFVSAQLSGHLDWGGYLQTAVHMAAQGHDVLWVSGADVADRVTGAGLPFHTVSETGWRWPPPPPLQRDATTDPGELRLAMQRRALDQWLDVARVTRATDELLQFARAWRPDIIVGEMFMAAAALVAENLKCPFSVVGWPAPVDNGDAEPTGVSPSRDQPSLVEHARRRLDELLSTYDLTGKYWTVTGPPALCSPYLHITYWSPSWFSGQPIGPQTHHVGGCRPVPTPKPVQKLALPSPEKAPWILITLGTSFNHDPNFFITAAHAATELGCLPILAVGSAPTATWVTSMLGRLPRQAIVCQEVDFSAVLPFTSAAIHHGGAGTTHALIRHAIPQIVVPHAADQHRQAIGVARTEIGLPIPPKQMTLERLVAALAQVLPDRSPQRQRAYDLQQEFDQLGGVPAAADLLTDMLDQWT